MKHNKNNLTWVSGVIFDCDGVIIDSKEANAAYYNEILSFFGLAPMTPEEEAYAFMATVDQALKRLLPGPMHARIEEARKSLNYSKNILPLIRLEEGLVDFLRLLTANNIFRGIHTNRSSGMQVILDCFALHQYFNPVVTAAMVRPKPDPQGVHYILKKWNIQPGQAVFIGDSSSDAETAKNAGVFFVAFGNKELASDMHVDNFAELAARFKDIYQKRGH